MKEYLFVYGMFRDAARPMLGDIISCGRTSVKGKLYKVNEFYPGFVESDTNNIWGEVFLVDSNIFPSLDNFEGNEYVRKKIKTKNDLECWIYVYIDSINSFSEIESGDWLLR
jgi:gamma-glutamylcyclotransferase (GGCT)/AIG2-like uncharacterized protein YtfP